MRTPRHFTCFVRVASVAVAAAVMTGCVTDGIGLARAPITTGFKDVAQNPSDVDKARAHLAAGRPGLAIESLRAAMAADPASVEVLNLMGVAFDRMERYDLARNYYRRALALQPASAKTLHNIGYSYYLERNYQTAAAFFESALPLASGTLEATLRGRLLALQNSLPTEGTDRSLVVASAAPMIAVPSRIVRTGDRTLELRTVPVPATGTAVATTQQAREESPPAAATVLARTTQASDSIPGSLSLDPSRVPLEISNGAGVRKLAARLSHYLSERGVRARFLTNADHFNYRESVIAYEPGYEAEAKRLAARLPINVKLVETPGTWATLRLILGNDLVSFDRTLITVLRQAGHDELVI